MKKFTFSLFFISSLFLTGFSQSANKVRCDFSDACGYYVGSTDTYKSYAKNGHYYIEHLREQGSYTFFKEAILNDKKDFSLEAKIMQYSGVNDYGFGIIWGVENANNLHSFCITSSGYFEIYSCFDGKFRYDTEWKKPEEGLLNPMGQYNVLKVEKKGSKMYFSINNTQVAVHESRSFFGHQLGFVVNRRMNIKIDYLEFSQEGSSINLVDNAINGYERVNLGSNVNTYVDEVVPLITHDGKTLWFARKQYPENYGPSHKDDIWYSKLGAGGNWGKAQHLGKPINNDDHNAVISVSPDGNTMLIMNTYNPDGTTLGAGISISNKTRNGWEIPKKVEIDDYYNDNKYAIFCLSPSKKVLVMTIQRDDTYGEKDIYVSFDLGGKFSKPMNLGNVVNTAFDESTVFLAADEKTLYFSSNGHPGYGDTDIFVTRRLDESWKKWSKPQNLGPEINTSGWDGYFTLPASGDYCYLVSTKNSIGKGDIFKIGVPEEAKPDPVILVYGRVLDSQTNQPVEAKIYYHDLTTGKDLGSALSDPVTGEYTIALPYGDKYSFMASLDGHYPVSENIDATSIKEYAEIKKDLYLSPLHVGQIVRLNNLFFDKTKYEIRPESYPELDRLVTMLRDNPKMKVEISGHTDGDGSHDGNVALSRNRALAVVKYLVAKGIERERLSYIGYGETKPVASNETADGRQMNRRVEFKVLSK